MTNKSAELRPLLLRPGKQVLSESFGWVVLAGWRLRRAYNRSTRLGFDRGHYPRFFDGPGVRKFCVPILPHYHRQLFPEIAFGAELPLFPSASFSPMLAHGSHARLAIRFGRSTSVALR
jgi:hypothetical protein